MELTQEASDKLALQAKELECFVHNQLETHQTTERKWEYCKVLNDVFALPDPDGCIIFDSELKQQQQELKQLITRHLLEHKDLIASFAYGRFCGEIVTCIEYMVMYLFQNKEEEDTYDPLA